MISMFERWYKRKFSDPNSVMLLLMLLVSSILLAVWGGILMPAIVAAVIAYLLDWPRQSAASACSCRLRVCYRRARVPSDRREACCQ